MKPLIVTLLTCLLLGSCRNDEEKNDPPSVVETPLASEELVANFPLLPLIEPRLWRELREAEDRENELSAGDHERAEASAQVEAIMNRLQQAHPFAVSSDSIVLGGISYYKKSRTLEIPAVVNYPDMSDTRHPNELELILCSTKGRTHETLFVADAQPLHLELLLHLAGFKKSSRQSQFRIDVEIPDHALIPIETMIAPADRDLLPRELLWQFSGSEFNDLYSPNQTGDFILLWQPHDSVFSVSHDKIASGEVKLLPVRHPELPDRLHVKLILTPVGT